jgi:hypothetical protein
MPEMKVPTPPSAPMMSIGPQPATPLTLEPDPVNPEPDDIPDPKVPETVKSLLNAPGTPFQTSSSPQEPLAPTTEPSGTALPYDALLQGFCAHLLTRMQGIADDLTTTTQQKVVEHMHNYHAVSMGVQQEVCTAVKAWIEATTTTPNEHAQYQLANVLEALQKGGVHFRTAPYRVTLQACTPSGYPVTFDVLKDDAGALVEELNNLTSWLVIQGYKPAG